MKDPREMTPGEITFNIHDIIEAIQINPENPKTEQYLSELRALREEETRRALEEIRERHLRDLNNASRALRHSMARYIEAGNQEAADDLRPELEKVNLEIKLLERR